MSPLELTQFVVSLPVAQSTAVLVGHGRAVPEYPVLSGSGSVAFVVGVGVLELLLIELKLFKLLLLLFRPLLIGVFSVVLEFDIGAFVEFSSMDGVTATFPTLSFSLGSVLVFALAFGLVVLLVLLLLLSLGVRGE